MKKTIIIFLFIISTLVLTACQFEDTPSDNDSRTVEITQFVSIGGHLPEGESRWTDQVLTQVTNNFKVNPQSVAIYNFDIIDMLFEIGIEKTDIKYLAYPHSNIPAFLKDHLDGRDDTNGGTLFIPDLTVLTAFQPDLIIIGGRSAGAYSNLKENFPNADILDVSTTYGDFIEGIENNASNLAKIFPSIAFELGMKTQVMRENMQNISNVAQDFEALFIMVNGEELSFFGKDGRFAALYDEFGFIPADPNSLEGTQHGATKSYEYIASINPQIIFLLDRAATIGESSAIENVLKNDLIKSTLAGTNNDIYILDGNAWYIATGGFMATQIMINDFNSFITKYSN